jgi:hypothetical protein
MLAAVLAAAAIVFYVLLHWNVFGDDHPPWTRLCLRPLRPKFRHHPAARTCSELPFSTNAVQKVRFLFVRICIQIEKLSAARGTSNAKG